MVTSVTGLSRTGLSDWLIQRVSAVVLGLYVLVLAWFFVCADDLTYVQWYQFMMSKPMKIFNVLALVALAAHAWVGLWTVATDYIKSTCIRLIFQMVFGIALAVYFLWGLQIFWV